MTQTIAASAPSATAQRDTGARPLKLHDLFIEQIRVRHYSRSTEKTYWHWIAGYIRHSGMRHPRDMGAADVRAAAAIPPPNVEFRGGGV